MSAEAEIHHVYGPKDLKKDPNDLKINPKNLEKDRRDPKKHPKDLKRCTKDSLKTFLDSFDVLLCDGDGVVFNKNRTPVPGVQETLNFLKTRGGKKIIHLSNNSSITLASWRAKLQKLNLQVETQDLVNPLVAIVWYLKKIGFKKKIFAVGTPSFKEELSKHFVLAEPEVTLMEEDEKALLTNQEIDEDVGAVVMDFDFNLTFLKLMKCSLYLSKEDVIFLTGGNDLKVPFGERLLMGPGYFQNIVADYSGKTPRNMGKPNLYLKEFLEEKFGLEDPSRVLLVGDSLSQDMAFAGRSGYGKLLTLTGVTKMEDLRDCSDEELPDYLIGSLGELHELFV